MFVPFPEVGGDQVEVREPVLAVDGRGGMLKVVAAAVGEIS